MPRKSAIHLVPEVVRRIGQFERRPSWNDVVAPFAERGVVVARQWLSRDGEVVATYKGRHEVHGT